MSKHDRPAVSTDPAPAGDGKGAATAAWATTSAVCLGGATLSATKLFTLAEKAGWDGTLAWLLFVILDGAALAGGLVWRYGRTIGARRYGAFVILESTVLSILGNIAAHLAEATGALPMIVVLTVGAIVPIQIVLTVHMAMLMSERPADTATAATATQAPEVAPLPLLLPATPTADEAEPLPAIAAPHLPLPESFPTEVAPAGDQPLPEQVAPRMMPATAIPESDIATGDTTSRSATATYEQRRVAPVADLTQRRQTRSAASKTNLMRQVFDEHVRDGRIDDLTGSELARRANANPSLGRKYMRQWREELDDDATGTDQ